MQKLSALRGSSSGATAIEFAIVAPVFFLIIFGVLEIGLTSWFSSLLNDGANQAGRYLRDQTMQCFRQGSSSNNCTAATIAGVRQAACNIMSKGGMSCDAQKLKIAVYSADNPVETPIPNANIIDSNAPNLAASRSYVIALGYEWPFAMLTTKLLLRTGNGRTQLQSRVYTTTAERALR